jgi:hypothetical protein
MEKFISNHLLNFGIILLILLFFSRLILYFKMYPLKRKTIDPAKETPPPPVKETPPQYRSFPCYFLFFGSETRFSPAFVRKHRVFKEKDGVFYRENNQLIVLGASYIVCKHYFPTLLESDEPPSVSGNKGHVMWFYYGGIYHVTFKDGILVKISEIWPDEVHIDLELKNGIIVNRYTNEMVGTDRKERLRKNSELEEKIRLNQASNV